MEIVSERTEFIDFLESLDFHRLCLSSCSVIYSYVSVCFFAVFDNRSPGCGSSWFSSKFGKYCGYFNCLAIFCLRYCAILAINVACVLCMCARVCACDCACVRACLCDE